MIPRTLTWITSPRRQTCCRHTNPSSAWNGYLGTCTHYPGTHYIPGYTGSTQYPFGFLLNHKISEILVFMTVLRLFNVTHFHVPCLLPLDWLTLPVTLYRLACLLSNFYQWHRSVLHHNLNDSIWNWHQSTCLCKNMTALEWLLAYCVLAVEKLCILTIKQLHWMRINELLLDKSGKLTLSSTKFELNFESARSLKYKTINSIILPCSTEINPLGQLHQRSTVLCDTICSCKATSKWYTQVPI